jgi:hypothetical protein
MSGDLFETPQELSALRLVLELPAGAPEPVVRAEALLQLGLAGDLVAEVDSILAGELAYMRTALDVGWAAWTVSIEDTQPPP